MIADLHIRGLGVIAESALEFSPGMVVFTGETGAGKTMLVGALGLILGDRADSGVVSGERAEVSARIVVAPGGGAAERVVQVGGDVEPDGTVTVSRSVSATGRGRAALGGAPAPVSALAEFGSQVAQRHSQSDQIQLRSQRRQRASLDAFGGSDLAAAKSDYQSRYAAYLDATSRLRDIQTRRDERASRAAELRAGIARIGALDPQHGEEESLPADIARLANAEQLAQNTSVALRALDSSDGDGGAVSALAAAQLALARVEAVDPGAAALGRRLAEASILVGELVGDLNRYADGLRTDPARLDALQQRRSALAALQRDFGPTAADIIGWAERAAAELAELSGAESEVGDLLAEVDRRLEELAASAAVLSRLRDEAAGRLSTAVTAELRELSMPHATFTAEVAQRGATEGLAMPDGRVLAFGGDGVDTVRYLLSPHSGAAAAPIGEGASGGELSRIMLALEVVLAESDPPSVFVFDEVDAGIGGRTAVEVGRRLARLADRSQVLVVTHLPQVAAFADQHVVVRKDSDGQVTRSSVAEVAGPVRTQELARMLSGQSESDVALAHAEELLRDADAAAGRS